MIILITLSNLSIPCQKTHWNAKRSQVRQMIFLSREKQKGVNACPVLQKSMSLRKKSSEPLNPWGKKDRDALLEDHLAATFPEYLLSIKEARADYRSKRIKSHKEVFGG